MKNPTERLVRRWLDAETTLDEERRLARLCADGDDPVAALLRGAAALRRRPVPPFRRPAARRRLLAWGTAAAVALTAAAWFATRPAVYGYIDGRPVTDAAEMLAAAEALEHLDSFGRTLEAAESFTRAIHPTDRQTDK